MSIKTHPHRANLYEQALLLADAHSRQSNVGDRWVVFIDNLAHICDEFAHSTNHRSKILDQLDFNTNEILINQIEVDKHWTIC